MTEKEFKKLYEEVLQRAIDADDSIVDMTALVDILKGEIKLNQKPPKWIEEILKKIERGAVDGNVGKVQIATFAGAGWSKAVGNFFEWCVYEELLNIMKKKFPSIYSTKDDATPTPSLSFSLQRYAMSFFKLFTTNSQVFQMEKDIRQTATLAAQMLEEEVGTNACEAILQAVAGSDPTGDLLLGNCMLELKYYSNPQRIRWFSFSDMSQFGENFGEFLKKMENDKVWDSNNRYLPQNQWIPNIQTIGLEGYMRYILKTQFSNSEEMLFSYLLHKGKYQVNTKKRIIIGKNVQYSGGKVQVSITQDIEALLELIRSKQWSSVLNNLKFEFLASQEVVGDVSLPEKQFQERSATNKKNRALRKKGEKSQVNWDSTTFEFYLQKGFYSPSILTQIIQ